MEKIEVVKANISGIKCDNKECSYRDDAVKCEDYGDWLNKPCPECGSNLLTESDYVVVLRMLKIVNRLNTFVTKITPSFLRKKVKPLEESKNLTKVTVELDGTGSYKMNVDKVDTSKPKE